MLEEIKKQVNNLLNQDNSGHGIEHVNKVLKLSLKFAETENANKEIVALIALLHDVDDYKLFGTANAKNLTNAKKILEQVSITDNIKEQVLNAIQTIGFNKRLDGISPTTLEAMIVSDADMCEGLGATGIIRCYQYNLAHNNKFFDKSIYPTLNMQREDYINKKVDTVVTHIFEKLLKLKDLMLTNSGKTEALKRHNIMVEFLYQFFLEEDVPEWTNYLDNYLKENKNKSLTLV